MAANHIVDLMNKFAIGCGGVLVIVLFFAFVVGLFYWGSYNRLVTLDQTVNKKWGDVQSVYQRRADLFPNLLKTVQGAPQFEKKTGVEVTKSRASVGPGKIGAKKTPPQPPQLQQRQNP